ncbi:MAG TPA: Lsr2 family protein [Acidimicrobiales bacterium]|nr:Lsr2 family protein [Acidimicrobiales bacterium]
MTRRTITVLSCDLCQVPEEGPEVSTIRFGWANRSYELDVCPAHAEEVKAALSGWARAGRPSRGEGEPEAPPRRRRRSAPTDRAQLEAIRRWAKDNGLAVTDHGRIPQRVADAFQAAHGTPRPGAEPA